MEKAKRFLSLGFVFAMLISVISIFTVSASAAPWAYPNKFYDVYQTREFTVSTVGTSKWYESKPSVTIEVKGVGGANAPGMVVKIYCPETGKTTTKYITGFRYKNTIKISLEKNHTYIITVSYYYNKYYSKGQSYKTVGGTLSSDWLDGEWRISKYQRCKLYG